VKRREFITLLGGTATLPLAARAQQPAMPIVGFVTNRSAEATVRQATAFRKGLNETGYVEGQKAHHVALGGKRNADNINPPARHSP
jgi:hypothetical protein